MHSERGVMYGNVSFFNNGISEGTLMMMGLDILSRLSDARV